MADDHLRVTELPFRENHDLLSGVRDEALSFTRDHFEYSREFQRSVSDCAFPAQCIRHGFPVVSSFATTAGITSDGETRYHSWDYSYEDPRIDVQGRGFLGFGVVHAFDHTFQSETTTTFDHRTRTTFLNANGVSVALYPHVGLPEKEVHVQPIFPLAAGETMEGPNRAFEEQARVTEVSRTYTLANNGSTYSVHPWRWVAHESEQHVAVAKTTIRLSTSVPATSVRTRSGTLAFDGYGNVTHEETHGDGLEQTRTNTYDNRTNDWLLGLLTDSKVWSSSLVNAEGCDPNIGGSTRETSYGYDALGRLVTTTVEPNASDPSVTSTTTMSGRTRWESSPPSRGPRRPSPRVR